LPSERQFESSATRKSNGREVSRLWMPAVLLEHQRQVRANELRARHAALFGGPGSQPVVIRIERNRGRLLPRECYERNTTRPPPIVKTTRSRLSYDFGRLIGGTMPLTR
jgi:hypothetical protein